MEHRNTELEEDIVKRQKALETDVVEQRLLVSNEESSIIIGRKGSNVERVRSESEALVTILKSSIYPNANERVMVIKGTPIQISTAISVIARILVENNRTTTNSTGSADMVVIKFLLHKFLAGCIIGQGGNIMKEIQSSANVRISVSTEALGGSTEKACSVTGTPDCLYAASLRIIDQLIANPLRPGCSTVLYVPGQAIPGEFYPISSHQQENFYSGAANYGEQGQHSGQHGRHAPHGGQHSQLTQHGQYNNNSYPDSPPGGESAPLRIAPLYQSGPSLNQENNSSGFYPGGYGRHEMYRVEPTFQKPQSLRPGAVQRIVPLAPISSSSFVPGNTEKIVIPKSASGAVIGRGGTIITNIKSQSGAQISIADAAANSDDRIVSITGSPQAIQNAIFLIRQRVESQSNFMPSQGVLA